LDNRSLVELAKGTTVEQVCKQIEVSEPTYYRRRNQFEGVTLFRYSTDVNGQLRLVQAGIGRPLSCSRNTVVGPTFLLTFR